MGEVLSNRQGDRSFLGGGRRASTLRARVRASKKYLAWLAVSADVAFPSEVSHLTGFLESRHSEPCNRGALKAAHQCMAFLEDVAGIDEKLTTNALYTVVYRELLQPRRTPRQAPRYPVAVLESLEELVLTESATFFLRVYAWWLLLQCWGTLRFADHRGLNPGRDFEVRGNALEARLTHSMPTETYVRKLNWLSFGWQLLTKKADFQRDYLLPAPSGNLKGCQHRELRYDTAYALQKRVMDVLVSDGQKLFAHGADHFWNPHSGRNYLPSAADALNVDKSDRDMLGGWTAQESDRYNRVARLRSQRLSPTVRNTTLFSKGTPSRSCACSCRNKVATPKYKPSTSRRSQDVPLLSSRVSKRSQKKKACRNKWNRETCNNWKKMRLIKSWRQRDGQMCGGDSRLRTLTDLRSLATNPKKLEDSSERVCSRDSTSPPARRKESRLCISSDHAT